MKILLKKNAWFLGALLLVWFFGFATFFFYTLRQRKVSGEMVSSPSILEDPKQIDNSFATISITKDYIFKSPQPRKEEDFSNVQLETQKSLPITPSLPRNCLPGASILNGSNYEAILSNNLKGQFATNTSALHVYQQYAPPTKLIYNYHSMPNALEYDKQLFCSSQAHRYLYMTKKLCNSKEPEYSVPWCMSPEASTYMIEEDCGYVLPKGSRGTPFVEGEIVIDRGIVSLYTCSWCKDFHNPVQFDSVEDMESFGTSGGGIHMHAHGHFTIETLPRLIRLYYDLPAGVPLLWPNNALTNKILDIMTRYNMLEPEGTPLRRPIISMKDGVVYKAKKIYFMFGNYHAGMNTYHIAPQECHLLRDILHKAIKTVHHPAISAGTFYQPGKPLILVMQRKFNRVVKNLQEIYGNLTATFPEYNVQIVDEATVSSQKDDWILYVKYFMHASVIIAPHGAGFTNLIAVRPNTLIIEIAFPQYPDVFFCLARTMQAKYYLVYSQGNHYTSLNPNVDSIVEIIKQEKKLIQPPLPDHSEASKS